MGFGILLFGFILSMSNYAGYTDFIAYALIFYSMVKLGVYNKYFNASKVMSFGLCVFGMAGIMLSLGLLIGFVDESNSYLTLYDAASEGVKIIFHFVVLLGIADITKVTDLIRYTKSAYMLIILNALYLVFYGLCFAFPMLLAWRMLLRLVFMIWMGVLIFNCYRMICLEGDEDMPIYNSRFEFVNRFRRRLDEKAEIGNRKGMMAAEYKKMKAQSKENGVDPNRRFKESRRKK